MPHNENSRVKIPALVHFTRLGYKYISLRKYEGVIDDDTNILVDVLCDAINRINATSLTTTDVQKIVNALKAMLENDDLGREFYSVLINGYNGLKLIDFEDFGGTVNSYHVVTEMTCKNGSDEFRPDITPLINGIPLAFIEVKKPNNKGGIKAEYDRMLMRIKNKKFRRFINLTQIMVFSNNSEYDDTEAVPLEGAFYSTISYEKLFFSHFREEDEKLLTSVPEKDEAVENFILTDNNLSSIKYSPEYVTNSSPVSPTNRIITSLFSFERILTFLKYAIAYVERTDENGITHLEKHLMRYPQFFATKAIENKLNAGVKNGIIWHTQGSGKTALAYYNVRYLTDYYQKHGTIAKFYFIVDRLDLLTQAANEFRARGLHVEETNSKEDFIKNIHSTGTVNNTGKPTITVVNIQKFSKESIAKQSDYAVNVQRIYFLDEAHRSYKPTGSFLANLLSSDREAVMIALTGTPLIGTIYDDDGKPIAGKKYDSKSVFGNYIHKYYYNRSIADGYTLKLIREGIETTYKKKLQKALEEIEMLKEYFSTGRQDARAMGRMTSVLKPVADRYNQKTPNERYQFRRQVRNLIKWYGYISQILRMFDKELHKEYVFCCYLINLLPAETTDIVDLEGKLKLEYYKLQKTFAGSIELEQVKGVYEPAKQKGAMGLDTKSPLDEIIAKINEKYKGEFTEGDKVLLTALRSRLMADKKLTKMAQTSDPQIFVESIFPKAFGAAAQDSYLESQDTYTSLFEDQHKYNAIMSALADVVYREMRMG